MVSPQTRNENDSGEGPTTGDGDGAEPLAVAAGLDDGPPTAEGVAGLDDGPPQAPISPVANAAATAKTATPTPRRHPTPDLDPW